MQEGIKFFCGDKWILLVLTVSEDNQNYPRSAKGEDWDHMDKWNLPMSEAENQSPRDLYDPRGDQRAVWS